MKLFTSCFFLIVILLLVTHVFAVEEVDTGTQRNRMHSCPEGEFVVGVHVNNNLLLCSNEFMTPNVGVPELVDSTTRPLWQVGDRFISIHQCPRGYAVTGIHVDRNELACALISGNIPRFLDSGTQYNYGGISMHRCPKGSPVAGIHVTKNILVCGTQD